MTGGRKKDTLPANKASQYGAGCSSPKQSSDRLRDTVSRLERFARTPHKDERALQPHSPQKDPLQSCDRHSGERGVRGSPERAQGSPEDRPHTKPAAMTEPTLADVLAAVNKCNAAISSLTQNIEGLKSDVLLIHQDLHNVRERTKEVECRVGALEDDITPLQKLIKDMERRLIQQEARLEDMENRMRRNNLRIVGLPEKAEGSNPVSFIETWLKETFGDKNLSSMFTVERAHRVPFRPPPPGALPRPFLLKLLHYRDRDAILTMARQKQTIEHLNSKISIYPDYSAEVQRKRAQYHEVKKRLRDMEITYSTIYPSKLRIADGKFTRFFENPQQATEWLDNHSKRQRAK